MWRLTTTAGTYHFDTKALKYEFKPVADKSWEALSKPVAFHRFVGTDFHLCAFWREIDKETHATVSRLELQDPRMAEIVKLRFYAGLSEKETAEALGISDRTVTREWKIARAFLQAELGG